jgi:murein DD-endopeptidase MepM/ murein hydrolase activator NlpD
MLAMFRRRVRAVTALALTVAALVPGATLLPAGAQTSNPDRVAELQEAIGEVSSEEAAALADLQAVRTQRAELDRAVADLDRQIAGVEQRIASLQGDVDRLTGQALELDGQVRATSAHLDVARQKAADAAAAMYRNEGAEPQYAGLLDAESLRDVYAGSQYLSHLSEERRAAVVSLGDLEAAIEKLRADAQAQRDQAEAAREQAASEREQLGGLRSEQAAKRAEIAEEEQREQEIVASIRARKDEFTAELAALQASSNAITTMLATRQKGQTKATNLHLTRPVPGGVTSSFGVRVHPVLGDSRMHNGIDMKAGAGDPIKAAASGTVAFAGVRSGYGNTVIIDHGNQYATLYGHASKLTVTTGEKVSAGETVALAGATGLATAPHLHFEVRLLGAPVNPTQFL